MVLYIVDYLQIDSTGDIMVLSNCDKVELCVDGRTVGRIIETIDVNM